MTQADFTKAIHDELGPDTKLAKSTLDAVLKAAATVGLRSLSEGGAAYLYGLGTIKPVKRAARKGRNPRTGAEIQIAAKSAPKYTASKAVKDALK